MDIDRAEAAIRWDSGSWTRLWARWFVGTLLGWVTGAIGAIILSHLVVNIFYPEETNLIVGLCVGAAVSAFQMRAMRPWLTVSIRWIAGGAVMMAPPFIAAVVFEELSLDLASPAVQMALGTVAVSGGLVGALLQAQALRASVSRPYRWIGATIVWGGMTAATEPVLGLIGAGVVLAMASGGLFVWLVRDTGGPTRSLAHRKTG